MSSAAHLLVPLFAVAGIVGAGGDLPRGSDSVPAGTQSCADGGVVDHAAPADSATAPATTINAPLPEASGSSDDSTVTVDVAALIVLGENGIGVADFCDDPDVVIDAVNGVLGPPDADSDWVEPMSISACAGNEARRVTWGSLDLMFGDESSIDGGRRHFFGFAYGDRDGFDVTPPGLSTDDGIGVGTTVEFLRAAYPDVQLIEGEPGVQDPTFYVNARLSGLLTDTTDDGAVTLIIGGDPCGV